jgi:hypothetical protein
MAHSCFPSTEAAMLRIELGILNLLFALRGLNNKILFISLERDRIVSTSAYVVALPGEGENPAVLGEAV